MASKYDDLEKLADLKNKGIITEEEFNTKKKEILGGSAVESGAGQKDSSTIKTEPIELSVHSKGNEADINVDHIKAFEITCEALKYIKYMKVEDANSIQGYIKISTSFDLMALKNPEIIEISIKSNSPQSSNIKIKSKIKNALGSGSKENVRNIFSMIDKCAKAHYSNEELKPIDYEKVKTVDEAVSVISKQAQDSFNTEKNTMLAPFFKPKALKVILIISAIFLFIGLITTLTDTTKKTNTSNTVSENDPIKILEKAPITQIDPADLGQIFNLMSEHTDIQRENKKKEIMGKIIAWRLPVYEVKKVKDNTYRIDTIGVHYVGTIAKVTARNAQESAYIEGLKTGSLITYKGKITDITLREIEVEPAILFGESAQVPVETPKVEAPIAKQAPTPSAAVNNNKVDACVDAWIADYRKEYGEESPIHADLLEEITRECEEKSRPQPVEPAERAGGTASAPMQTPVENTIGQVNKIINAYLTATNYRNIDTLLSLYENEVDYFGTGIVKKDFIMKDKMGYFAKWTAVNHTILGQPQIYAQEYDIISVKFSTNWMVQNNKKTINGTADNTWKLRKTESGLKIIDEKQKVTSRF